ncbi:MAG TPA: hypothetical protein ENK32_02320 [Anaerolineae bacterium]|nr:hypothetical protein [Anaerolineae bacterium]
MEKTSDAAGAREQSRSDRKRTGQRLAALIQEVQSANPDSDPDEVMRDVLDTQHAIRNTSTPHF